MDLGNGDFRNILFSCENAHFGFIFGGGPILMLWKMVGNSWISVISSFFFFAQKRIQKLGHNAIVYPRKAWLCLHFRPAGRHF